MIIEHMKIPRAYEELAGYEWLQRGLRPQGPTNTSGNMMPSFAGLDS